MLTRRSLLTQGLECRDCADHCRQLAKAASPPPIDVTFLVINDVHACRFGDGLSPNCQQEAQRPTRKPATPHSGAQRTFTTKPGRGNRPETERPARSPDSPLHGLQGAHHRLRRCHRTMVVVRRQSSRSGFAACCSFSHRYQQGRRCPTMCTFQFYVRPRQSRPLIRMGARRRSTGIATAARLRCR